MPDNINLDSLDDLIFLDIPFDEDNLNETLTLAEKEDDEWNNLEEKKQYFAIERYKEDTKHRSTMSSWAATVVSGWLITILGIIIYVGRGVFIISDSVLITLLATTTINVLGLMIIVLNDFFKNKGI